MTQTSRTIGLLSLAMVASLAATVAAQTTAPASRPAAGTVKKTMRSVWRDSVKSLPDSRAGRASSDDVDLQSLINELDQLEHRLDQQIDPSTKVVPVEPAQPVKTVAPATRPAPKATEPVTTRPTTPKAVPAAPKATAGPKVAVAPAPKPTSKAAVLLAEIRKKAPENITDPVALADQLYREGARDAARTFYELALTRNAKDIDKAWVHLQLGNCLREKDPALARERYQVVVQEFPKSAWAPVARAQSELIEWRMRTQLTELLADPADETPPRARKVSLPIPEANKP